jgi:hypothetical protein
MGRSFRRYLRLLILEAVRCQHFLNRWYQLLIKSRLVHETRCADRACDSTGLSIGGEAHNDCGTFARGNELRKPSRIRIGTRHSKVNQENIGFELDQHPQGVGVIPRFAYHLETRITREKAPNCAAYVLGVVSYEDGGHNSTAGSCALSLAEAVQFRTVTNC